MPNLTNNDIALNLYLNSEAKDVDKNIELLARLVGILHKLQNELENSQEREIPYNRRLITFISKMMLHATSISELLKGSIIPLELKEKNIHIIDIPSIQVLLRSLIETFCMFYFIYRHPDTKGEIQFRYDNWLYSGILSRVKLYSASDDSNFKAKRVSDEKFINDLKSQIASSVYFDKLPKKQQERLLKRGDPRLGNNWTDILNESGINKKMAVKIYHLLSSMAHSTGLGLIQLNEMKLGYHKNHQEGYNYSDYAILFISQFIIELIDHIDVLNRKYKKMDSKDTYFIEFYSKIYKATRFEE